MAPMTVQRSPAMRGFGQWLSATPGRIALCLAAVVLSLLLAAAANLHAASSAASVIRTIGTDAEPSVVLALQIGATLSDMDAAAAEDALSGGFSATGASRRWWEDKARLDDLMVRSARNITYAKETAALQGLLRWVGEYHASLAEVRGAADPAHPFIATQRLQWSHRLLTEFALPEARALADANRTPLEAAYGEYNGIVAGSGILGVSSALIVSVVLAAVQVFLWRRTRRMFSPPVVLAALIGVAMAAGLLLVTLREREAVRSAKTDCYDSLSALFDAKGVAAAMNADLSYWLLDPAARRAASDALNARMDELLVTGSLDRSRLRANLDAAQRLERDGHPVQAREALPAMSGLLGKELANVTFGAAERDPASDTVRFLLDFVQAANRVRSLDAPENRVRAVLARDTEAVPALAGLQSALDRTVAVNQVEFDARIGRAQRLATWTPIVVCAGLALIGLLTAAGLWPRYREYMRAPRPPWPRWTRRLPPGATAWPRPAAMSPS